MTTTFTNSWTPSIAGGVLAAATMLAGFGTSLSGDYRLLQVLGIALAVLVAVLQQSLP